MVAATYSAVEAIEIGTAELEKDLARHAAGEMNPRRGAPGFEAMDGIEQGAACRGGVAGLAVEAGQGVMGGDEVGVEPQYFLVFGGERDRNWT